MQVPELRDLMKKIYGYSRGNKTELINKIWTLAGVFLDVVVELYLSCSHMSCGSYRCSDEPMQTVANRRLRQAQVSSLFACNLKHIQARS